MQLQSGKSLAGRHWPLAPHASVMAYPHSNPGLHSLLVSQSPSGPASTAGVAQGPACATGLGAHPVGRPEQPVGQLTSFPPQPQAVVVVSTPQGSW
jgi:hypothetical protein